MHSLNSTRLRLVLTTNNTHSQCDTLHTDGLLRLLCHAVSMNSMALALIHRRDTQNKSSLVITQYSNKLALKSK